VAGVERQRSPQSHRPPHPGASLTLDPGHPRPGNLQIQERYPTIKLRTRLSERVG